MPATDSSYGLSWNKVKEGHILSASEDTTVAHWDIQQYKKDGNGIPPLRKYTGHSAYVGVSSCIDQGAELTTGCGLAP